MFQINYVKFHLKELEKKEQNKPKASKRKEIKTKVEFNGIKNRKKKEKNLSLFLEKTNNIDKLLLSLPKGKKKEREEPSHPCLPRTFQF